MSEADADFQMVREHVNALAEHFDSVQIFCTRHEGSMDATVNVHLGSGNWFARYGFVQNWLIRQDESERSSRRND